MLLSNPDKFRTAHSRRTQRVSHESVRSPGSDPAIGSEHTQRVRILELRIEVDQVPRSGINLGTWGDSARADMIAPRTRVSIQKTCMAARKQSGTSQLKRSYVAPFSVSLCLKLRMLHRLFDFAHEHDWLKDFFSQPWQRLPES